MLTLFKGLTNSVHRMLAPCLAPVSFVALVAAGLVAPAAVGAQEVAAPCRLCGPVATDSPDSRPTVPIRLEVATRLDFDKVVFGGTGEAQVALSPDGASRMSGAAAATGSRAMPGSVVIRGEPGRAVRIDLPRQVDLYGDGSGTIRIESIVTDLPSFPRIGDDGTLSFRFGGDLRISGDGDGAYRGSIDILVEYL